MGHFSLRGGGVGGWKILTKYYCSTLTLRQEKIKADKLYNILLLFNNNNDNDNNNNNDDDYDNNNNNNNNLFSFSLQLKLNCEIFTIYHSPLFYGRKHLPCLTVGVGGGFLHWPNLPNPSPLKNQTAYPLPVLFISFIFINWVQNNLSLNHCKNI